MNQLPHIPALRGGVPYESLDTVEILDSATGSPIATVSQINSGLIRRDLLKIESARIALSKTPTKDLIEICRRAASHFLESTLPDTSNPQGESPQEYIERLSASTGLPHSLCRSNMGKIHFVLSQIDTVLNGLTRDLPLEIFDSSLVQVDGLKLSFYSSGNCLGVVLPSNSPGVNSLWLPCLAMKIPVVLKPGRNDPWTPYRIVRSLIEAGYPRKGFYFYPSDHEGSEAILGNVDRGIIFGGDATIKQYATNPRIQVHGPGRSKVLIGQDWADRWESVLDLLIDSIASNSGRSCINASSILVTKHADKIAQAIAEKLVRIVPLGREDKGAKLAGFTEQPMVDFIDQTIESGLAEGGAEDVTSRYRSGHRVVEQEGLTFVLPTIIRCRHFGHPLANTEMLFPYASVVELPQEEMLHVIGYSLVVTAITSDPDWRKDLLRSRQVDRLNLGPTPTSQVDWDQPHEGNLFEFLYRRRAIHEAWESVGLCTSQHGWTCDRRLKDPSGDQVDSDRFLLHSNPRTKSDRLVAMNSFTTRPMPRIIFGCGAIQELGFQITELGLRRPLLVTDPGIVAAGHVKRAEQILKVSGATVVIFDRVEENPTSRCVEACVEVAKSGAVDGIVGLGGGSSLDTAKGCNFVLTNGGEIEEYQGFGRAKEPMLPFLAVPTTAGTGSECQSYALISDPETHEKMACGDLKAMAAVAILDPELILSQPAAVAENSGIDALAHALESAVARNRNEYSSHYSRAAFRLIEANLETLLDHPDDEEARSCMLLGAAYAGVAIENSMLGCAHAAANPLTAKLGLVHGRAVGLMLPPTMRFNTSQDDALATYSEYAREVDPEKQSDSPEAAADRLNLRVQSLVERSNQGQTSLEPARVLNLIDELADAAARQWTAQYNPREVTKEDFVCLYKEAFDRLAK